ncbi:MAG: hypothetical protein HYR85_02235 [Planctomycetes bacterium]|nr:hypothetical protein [Planctomycetota bacterium]MBI3848410.1 hypothetical protein [Planctomycetota bacterium]
MKRSTAEPPFVVCVRNDRYKASLVVRRIYRVISDADARRRGLVRVIDESGEDYLFPAKLFVAIELPKAASKMFSTTS